MAGGWPLLLAVGLAGDSDNDRAVRVVWPRPVAGNPGGPKDQLVWLGTQFDRSHRAHSRRDPWRCSNETAGSGASRRVQSQRAGAIDDEFLFHHAKKFRQAVVEAATFFRQSGGVATIPPAAGGRGKPHVRTWRE